MAAAKPKTAVTAGLPGYPASTDRRGSLAVPSPHVTGAELKPILTSLEHPPPKADFESCATNVIAAVIAIFASLKDYIKDPVKNPLGGVDFVLLVCAAVVGGFAIRKYASQRNSKDPHYENAKETVRKLLEIEQAQATQIEALEVARAEEELALAQASAAQAKISAAQALAASQSLALPAPGQSGSSGSTGSAGP